MSRWNVRQGETMKCYQCGEAKPFFSFVGNRCSVCRSETLDDTRLMLDRYLDQMRTEKELSQYEN